MRMIAEDMQCCGNCEFYESKECPQRDSILDDSPPAYYICDKWEFDSLKKHDRMIKNYPEEHHKDVDYNYKGSTNK